MQPANFPTFQTTHTRWRAITQRDPAAHYSFIYGVKSTKIYCRPTCTARVARRANVVYYDTIAQAGADGYRPCARCKPDDIAFVGQREEIVIRILDSLRVQKNSARVEGGVKELARNVGVTPSYLCRVFKKTMGCTLGQYCRDFEVAVVPNQGTTVRSSPSTAESELSSSIRSPAPVSTTSSPLAAVESPPVAITAQCVPSSTGMDEDIDIDFDFSEWLWTGSFDLDGWVSPHMDVSSGGS